MLIQMYDLLMFLFSLQTIGEQLSGKLRTDLDTLTSDANQLLDRHDLSTSQIDEIKHRSQSRNKQIEELVSAHRKSKHIVR